MSFLARTSLAMMAVAVAVGPALAREPELIGVMGHHWGTAQATAALNRRFPPGTTEAALQEALKKSGFKLGKAKPDGKRKAFSSWGGGFSCTDMYTVSWRADPQGVVRDLKGDVEGNCAGATP